MKKYFILAIAVLIFGGSGLVYYLDETNADATDELLYDPFEGEVMDAEQERELGVKWAEYYVKKMVELENVNIDLNHDITVDVEDVKQHISRYYADRETYQTQVTEEDAKEKVYEWALLAEYAKEQHIYPTEQEINEYIQQRYEDTMTGRTEADLPPFIQGLLEGLNITFKEYVTEFERYTGIASLVILNIADQLKGEYVQPESETDIDYHNRIIEKVEKLAEQLKKQAKTSTTLAISYLVNDRQL